MADDTSTNAPEMGGAEPHDDFDLPLSSGSSAPFTASPDDSAAGTSDADQTDPSQKTATPDDGMGHYPAELAAALRDERLKPVPGETTEAAYARLNHHLIRKNVSYRRDLAREKDRYAQSIDAMRAELAPMLQTFYHQQRQAQLEAEAAQIPDPDSPEYQTWLLEESLRRDDERRRVEWEREQEALRTQEEQRVLGYYRQLNETGFARVAHGLGLVTGTQPDHDFAAAYDTYSEMAVATARAWYPNASEEQIHEFVSLSQSKDIQNFVEQGQDPVEGLKMRFNGLIDALERRGLVTRTTKGRNGPVAGNGNGDGRPSPAPVPKPPGPAPSTAQRVQADAAAAQRRAPSAVPSSARPTQLPGQIPDPSQFASDEDFVEAALDGILGTEAARLDSYKRRQAERNNRGGGA